MPILQIEHRVRDYAAWKQSFDSDPLGREQGGVKRYRILRPTDDPSYVVVDLEFDSADDAEAFQAKLRELWGRVEEKLGLEGLRARILETVETKEYDAPGRIRSESPDSLRLWSVPGSNR